MPLKRLFAPVLLAALAGSATGAFADTASDGRMIVARGGAHATLLWDATPLVARLGAQKTTSDDAMRTIEREALDLAASLSAHMPATRSETIRIVYQQSGAVSETYHTATFDGVVPLVTIDVERATLLSRKAQLEDAIAAGHIPEDLKLRQTGKLPES